MTTVQLPANAKQLAGAAVMTFKVNVRGAQPPAPQAAPEVTPEVAPQVMRLLSALEGTMDRQAKESAVAVETYNRLTANFRSSAYVVLMIIASAVLFHAIYEPPCAGKRP